MKKIKDILEFHEKIYKKYINVFFIGTTTCGVCKMMGPVIENIIDEEVGGDCFYLNASTIPEIAEKFQIAAVPYLLIYKDGDLKEKGKISQPDEIREILTNLQ